MVSVPNLHQRNDVRVELVTNQEQLLHTLAVRAICYIEEHGYSAHQTFDANDFHSTHVIVYVHEEPIGSARVRWFRDFAKIERTAFLKDWRSPEMLKRTAQFIFDHVAQKGYDRLITHAQPAYARIWRRYLGFKIDETKEPFTFEGHAEPYLELVKTLAVPSDAVGERTDIATLFRTEGAWTTASRFEAKP